MADNTTVKDAADATVAIATDDVGAVHYQRVKLDVGGDGASVPVVGTLPVSGTVAVTGPLTDAELRAADVVVTLDGESVPVTGTFWQATQPVSGPLTDAELRATPVPVSGTVSVSEPVTVDATDLDIRNLTATDVISANVRDGAGNALTSTAGGASRGLDVVIRDGVGNELDLRQENENWTAADHGVLMFGRDTTSVPNKYRALNLSAEGDVHCDLSDINGIEPAVNAGNADNGTLRVVLATNQPTVAVSGPLTDTQLRAADVKVTLDGEGVTGTVTANAGTNLNTSALALESGGNLAAAATSLAVLDDWDESDRAKVNPIAGQAGVQGGSGAVSATTQRVVLATDVALPAGANALGSVIPNQYELAGTTLHVKKYYTNAGAVTDGIVWSPAAGKRWYVTDIFLNVSAAATVTLEDDLSGGDSVVWKAELAANSGWSHSFATPLFSGEDAADLLITTTAGNVYVMVTGYEV